jgi:NAD(P)H-nitrite reductase large subunit
MSSLHVKYLLVGGGLAGSSAAEAIRARDREGSILLIGQEINRPYHRPPLSKQFLRREQERAQLWTRPMGWYEEQDIQLRTGQRVAQLDCSRRAVTLASGQEISFEKLLLATGASPRPLDLPGADLPNLFYLRTIEDAERLYNAVEQARAEGRKQATGAGRGVAVVIGGGVLGVELASSLRMMGLEAHLIATRHPWEKFAGESTGKFVARYVEHNGVIVHAGQRPQRLEGDGRVQRIVLPGGAIDCDFAVASIGININRELLRGTPIAAERAIRVDEHCRTSVEHIYAAGDCASMFDPLFGKHRILDHWDSARLTGELAGANMAGEERAYDAVSYFFSDVFDLSMQTWGYAKLVHHRITRGTPSIDSPQLVEIGIAPDGRITQAIAVNRRPDEQVLHDLVRHRARVEGREEELKDPTRDLREFLS